LSKETKVELTRKRTGGGGDLKGLLATRQGTIAVALTATLVAVGILVFAVNRYRQSVNAANAQTTVLVARDLIQKGTSGNAIAAGQLYAPTKVIQKHVSFGAISDAGVLSGKVAVTNILPGQQLTASDFALTTGTASQLATNQRAISIPLDSSHGLSGVVTAGDHVDVYVGFAAPGGVQQIRLLVPNVLVLSAAGATGGVGGSANGNVVLAINDNQAAEVAYASDNGKIWLVLRPGNAQTATQTVATLQSILAAQPPLGSGGKP
jgi:Flp pilus assembly protein CpaB